LIESHAAGKRTVLIIDEAQNLSVELLEQVRLLSNLETSQHKLLRIVLIGQPELKALLAKHELRQLNQRITARYHLRNLTLAETETYIGHRLSISGARRPLFTKSAMQVIYKHSKGTPRLINVICDRALIGAYSQEQSVVNKQIAAQSVAETMNPPAWKNWIPDVNILKSEAIYPIIGGSALVLFWSVWLLSDKPTSKDPDTKAPVAVVEDVDEIIKSAEPKELPETSVVVEYKEKPKEAPKEAPEEKPEEVTSKPVTKVKPRDIQPISKAVTDIVPIQKIETPEEDLPAIFSMDLITKNKVVQNQVFRELFKKWQVNFDLADGKTLCAKARTSGLQCLKKHGGWSLIRQFNRPVLIKLKDGNKKGMYALVESLPSNQVALYLDQTYHVDFKLIEPYWDEEFVLLWKPPQITRMPIKEGDFGDDVLWLKQQLGLQDPGDSLGKHYYDRSLAKNISQFQKEHLLKQDGVVGEQTLFYIVMFSQATTDPVLQRTNY
jgi:general secretion pathway protein A